MLTLIYWVDAHILQRKKTKTSVIASKEISLEVNPEKIKYVVIS